MRRIGLIGLIVVSAMGKPGIMERLKGAWEGLTAARGDARPTVLAPEDLRRAIVEMVKKDGADSVFQGIPAYWFSRAIEIGGTETLFEPYRNSVWVMSAIKKVAGPVSSMPVEFYNAGQEVEGFENPKIQKPKSKRRSWRNGMVRTDREGAIEIPEMEQLMRQPMPGMGYADFINAFCGWMKLKGENFWLIPDDMMVPFPEVRAQFKVIVARPDRMRHVVENGILEGWVYSDADGKAWELTPEQVIQTKLWNPYNKWRGLGEYEAALIAAEGDYLAGKFSRNLMANNGDTGPYIVAKNGVPTDAQRDQIINELRAKRQAQLRGDFRPIFMTGDITVEDPQVQSVDAQFISQRLENRHEIFIAFGVPPSLADVKAAYSIGSASDFYQLITNTCVPIGDIFCDALERLGQALLKKSFEAQFVWDEHPVFQEVRKERLASIETLANRGMPMRVVSDYLGLELPSFEGDDVGYLPISIMPVSEANQPAPEPENDQALAEVPPAGEPPSEEPKSYPDGVIKEMMAALRRGEDTAPHLSKRAAGSKAIWERHMRARAGVLKMYQSKTKRILNSFRAVALRKLESHGGTKILTQSREEAEMQRKSLVDFIFDANAFGRELVGAFKSAAMAAMQKAGEQVYEDLGKDDPWEMPPQKALEFIRGRDQLVMGAGQTVRSQLNTALEEGYKNGESTEQLADRVRGVFNNLSKYEARRIAATETAATFNFAGNEAMRLAGVQFKSWISSHGPNVRQAHADAEAEYGDADDAIPFTEPFVVDGEELMYPCDPSGSPGNVINCQCICVARKAPKEEA